MLSWKLESPSQPTAEDLAAKQLNAQSCEGVSDQERDEVYPLYVLVEVALAKGNMRTMDATISCASRVKRISATVSEAMHVVAGAWYCPLVIIC